MHTRLQTLKVRLKMLMSYFSESRSFPLGKLIFFTTVCGCADILLIFVTIREGSLEFDLIILQLKSKIAFST